MFVGKDKERKIATIGQCVIKATRPRNVLPPLQIGLAIQMHHHFRSRYLLDTLSAKGLCASYQEVQNFERVAAVQNGGELNGKVSDDSILLFVGDNVDHNICTLDGKNTFHGMGIIAALKYGIFSTDVIKRRNVSNTELLAASKVDIVAFNKKKVVVPRSTLKY